MSEEKKKYTSSEEDEQAISDFLDRVKKPEEDWEETVHRLAGFLSDEENFQNLTILGAYGWEIFKNRYESLFPTMKDYMSAKGYIKPASPREMYQVFITEMIDKDTVEGLTRALKRKDFKKFHDIIEKEIGEVELSVEDLVKEKQITKEDIIFRFLELRDSGFSIAAAVEQTREWLKTNGIDPDTTKELFNITVSEINPDSFRKVADSYYADYLKKKRNNPE